MTTLQAEDLKTLYEQDETAWLERSVRLIREGKTAALDFCNLSEFLESMAKRDRREVVSRLAVLLAHVLKWTHQPQNRSRAWLATVEVQRHELEMLLESGTLRNHAEAELDKAYRAAVRQAALETGLDAEVFPPQCPFSVQDLLQVDLPVD